MPIYFSGSISGGRDDAQIYARIASHLMERGYRVHGGEVTNGKLSVDGESLSDEAIFSRDMEWLETIAREGGVVVAEISTPSLGVGYEIAVARYRLGMPVICLYRTGTVRRCSAMIAGDPGIVLIRYSDETFEEMLQSLVSALRERVDPARQAGANK